MFIDFDAVIWRDHFLSFVDRFQPLTVVRINETKFEFGHARELITRFLNLGGIEPGNLDKNPIAADRTDDWFADAEVIDPFANDFDGLVEHTLIHHLVPAHEPD